MTYAEWKKEVDAHFTIVCGISTDHLPDAPYRDWYDDELPPKAIPEHYAHEWDDTGMILEMLPAEYRGFY